MQELWFLRAARHLMLIDIYMKFREDSLNAFQVIKQTGVWQTDRQTDAWGKTICLPNLKGGDIIITEVLAILKYEIKYSFWQKMVRF